MLNKIEYYEGRNKVSNDEHGRGRKQSPVRHDVRRKKKEVVDLSPETQSRHKNEKNATDVSTVETLKKRTEGEHKKRGHAVDKP